MIPIRFGAYGAGFTTHQFPFPVINLFSTPSSRGNGSSPAHPPCTISTHKDTHVSKIKQKSHGGEDPAVTLDSTFPFHPLLLSILREVEYPSTLEKDIREMWALAWKRSGHWSLDLFKIPLKRFLNCRVFFGVFDNSFDSVWFFDFRFFDSVIFFLDFFFFKSFVRAL